MELDYTFEARDFEFRITKAEDDYLIGLQITDYAKEEVVNKKLNKYEVTKLIGALEVFVKE